MANSLLNRFTKVFAAMVWIDPSDTYGRQKFLLRLRFGFGLSGIMP
jgi:hypothetical protein